MSRRTILIVTPQLPYPPHQGTSLRNFNIIRGLANNHDVVLLSFDEGDSMDRGPLPQWCRDMVTVPVPRRTVGKRLRQLVTTRRPDMAHRLYDADFNTDLTRLLRDNQCDVVQIEGIELARAIEIVRQESPGSRIVFDDHNAETALQRRAYETDRAHPKRWIAAAYSRVQIGRLARFEAWACREADAVAVVSDADKWAVASLHGVDASKVTVIPNCIDTSRFRPKPDQPTIPFDIVFTGKMDYRPNIDAVLWFADAIWPRIRAAKPDATWAIVGQKPHARLDRLRRLDGVTITGWVDQVEPYIHGAGVFVMPFRMGSGTRLKLIEAFATGKAVVSTSIGCEGYGVRDGVELCIADAPVDFAAQVLALLDSAEKRTQFSHAAQTFAQQYDWRVIVPRFETLYQPAS
ncbi:MAG: glycosyltransferase [Anaerolineae bacterium]|nr:glycosyltransferase [Anaerolineae bacterium]MCO5207524.1 glycosyltransferase [Anaerolineae bacterium]